jgi:hypothetical protein
LRRLQLLAEGLGVASRNRVEAIVAYFHQYGLLDRRTVPDDRRLIVIVPTRKMWMFQTEFLDAHQTPLPLVDGLPPDRAPECESPRWMARRALPVEQARDLIMMGRRYPLMQRFAERDSGCLFLLLLIRSASGDDTRVVAPYAELAQLAGVSRTQIRLLMEDAEGEGLLSLRAPGGRCIELRPLLRETVDCWIAEHISFFSSLGSQVPECPLDRTKIAEASALSHRDHPEAPCNCRSIC